MSKKSNSMRREMISAAEGLAWNPEKPGEKFCGVIISRRMVDTQFGYKPVVSIANEETGEVIEQFCSNLATRRLANVPDGTYVELVYRGEEEIKIGRSKKLIKDISASFEKTASGKMLDGSWMLVAMKPKKAAKTKTRK